MSAATRPAARATSARGTSARGTSAPRKQRVASKPARRFGRLGSWGWAAVLGIGAVVLSPVVHAFWGDAGVIMLGVFGLGFLLGRWTAVA